MNNNLIIYNLTINSINRINNNISIEDKHIKYGY